MPRKRLRWRLPCVELNGTRLLTRLGAGTAAYEVYFFDVQTTRCGAQCHFLYLGLHSVEHEDEARGLAIGNV